MSSNDGILPPLPKLRPRPGFKMDLSLYNDLSITPVAPKSEHFLQLPKRFQLQTMAMDPANTRTSRLLTKSECRGIGGRKRSAGSVIHSIPKFTQVQPSGGCISKVQKVLQSRLLEKQKLQRQNSDPSPTPSKDMEYYPDMKATSILQNFVKLHESSSRESLSQSSTKGNPSEKKHRKCHQRKRGRKPDKSDIFRLVPIVEGQDQEKAQSGDVIPDEAPSVPFSLPKLSEVTITPAVVSRTVPKKPKTSERSPSPEIVEIRKQSKVQSANKQMVPDKKLETISHPPPVLKPDEYESLGMPIGYVYWASVNTFVHISHIPPQYLDVHGQPIFPFNVPISDPYHFPTKRVLDKKSEPMEILTSVMKIKPYKPNQNRFQDSRTSESDRTLGNRKTTVRKEPHTEVSIGKFKFTGGIKPTLEEKKMLSVDSIGNLKFCHSNQILPFSNMMEKKSLMNLSSHFQAGTNFRPLGAIDLLSAFEALPEHRDSSHLDGFFKDTKRS